MSFPQRLADAARRVEERLADELGSRAARGAPPRLVDAMRHAALGGGKRFRPFLVMECAGLLGVPADQAVATAAALECVHCYSLAHDDLPAMDNDRLRRGMPTVWAAYDEWTAILAGDGLLTLAFELLSGEAAHPDPAVRIELVSLLAQASGWGGMVGGQALDLEAEKLGTGRAWLVDDILAMQAMKTGALIAFAAEAGAILGRADGAQRAALRRYGDLLGVAFQIADDLLDAEGDAATVGKATGKDAALGKATLVSSMGVAAARARLAEVEAQAIAALAPFGAAAAALCEAARFVAARTS